MASIFGYEITKKEKPVKSFAAPENDDGAATASSAVGGAWGQYLDLDGSWKNEIELINKYRGLQTQAEVDAAIDDIVNRKDVKDRDIRGILGEDKLSAEVDQMRIDRSIKKYKKK